MGSPVRVRIGAHRGNPVPVRGTGDIPVRGWVQSQVLNPIHVQNRVPPRFGNRVQFRNLKRSLTRVPSRVQVLGMGRSPALIRGRVRGRARSGGRVPTRIRVHLDRGQELPESGRGPPKSTQPSRYRVHRAHN